MESDTRNHKLVKVMADTSNKRVLLAIFCFGLALLVTMYIVSAFAIPNTFFYISGLEDCPDDFSTFKGFCHSFSLQDHNVWESYLAGFDKKNTFFVITGMVERDQSASDVEMGLELDFKAIVIPIDDNGDPLEKANNFEHTREHKFIIHCDAGSIYCEEHGFILYPRTDHKNYRIRIEIEIDNMYKSIIKGIRFFAKTQNPEYTKFLLAVRYTCFAISLAFSVWFFVFYKTIKPEYKTFEHKYILILSIAVLFFNDPLYGATVMKSSTFLAILSALFVVTFIGLLMFFWIVMVQRMHKESIHVSTQLVNFKNIALGTAAYITLTVIVCISSLISRFDPGYHVDAEYPVVYEVIMIIVVIIYTVLLILFFFNAYKVFKVWNKIIPRHKFFFLFSFYFIIALFFLIITGLYNATDYNGVRVLMLFVLFNFYMIVLQLMWRFDRSSHKHFIDIKNYKQSSNRHPEVSVQRDTGMNYFDNDCEIEITKTGGLHRRDDSMVTVEADNEPVYEKPRDFETAQFPNLKEKSNIDDKISFNQFHTSPNHNRIVEDEEHSSFEIDYLADNIKDAKDEFIFEENQNDNVNQEVNNIKDKDDESDDHIEFGYKEFKDVDEQNDDTNYEFGQFKNENKEDHK